MKKNKPISLCNLKNMHISTDISECAHSHLNDCDPVNGVCTDEPEGSYTCSCKPGYVPDGSKCIGKNRQLSN